MAASDNPFTADMSGLVPQPCVLCIFGAAGDLAWRKLLPAVYNLNVDGQLPSNFAILGFGVGSEGDGDEWIRARAKSGIEQFSRRPLEEKHWNDFARMLFYLEGDFKDPTAYQKLKGRLAELDQQFGIPGSRVFYFSIPPQLVPICVSQLKEGALVTAPEEKRAFSRAIVEKPIGRDLSSAQAVNAAVAVAFHEDQTFRIDHYLGKETVQNLLVLRFANSILEPLWNQKYIDHVQITVAEEEGLSQWDEAGNMTASRIGYYEGVGALRDMVQNHILQVLCIIAMEPPWSLEANVIRDAKIGVLRCLRPLTPAEVDRSVVRAQYTDGDVHGEAVPGYTKEVRKYFEWQEKPIPPSSVNSTTETFVALRVYIDNWRWAGVPFYLRTGKRLPKRGSEVAIQFKEVPQVLFNSDPAQPLEPNVLSFRVQPEEGMALRIASKLPGPKVRIYPVKMEFNYATGFGQTSPEAYERLILDVMAGDATLFMRRDQVEAAWNFVMPILDRWQHAAVRYLSEYPAGSWGPIEADRLIEADNRRWRTL